MSINRKKETQMMVYVSIPLTVLLLVAFLLATRFASGEVVSWWIVATICLFPVVFLGPILIGGRIDESRRPD